MSADHQLHAFFFPINGSWPHDSDAGHCQTFNSRGVKTTIITTPHNAPFFTKTTTQQINSTSAHISLRVIKFPAIEADMLFPWATDVAAKFDIPRLVFHGTSFFALCASQSVALNKPFKKVSSESEQFVIPDLPHEIKLTRAQVDPHHVLQDAETLTEFPKLCNQIEDSEIRSHGAIINSFYELEPEYADHYRKVLKKKACHIGPVSLCNREVEDKAHRGKAIAVDEHEYCLKWLGSKKPKLVVYVCFGSVTSFSAPQLFEIAKAIEASEYDFIWVVSKAKNEELEEEDDDLKTWSRRI